MTEKRSKSAIVRGLAAGAWWWVLYGAFTFLGSTPGSEVIDSRLWEFVFSHPNGMVTRLMGLALIASVLAMAPFVLGPERVRSAIGLRPSPLAEKDFSVVERSLALMMGVTFALQAMALGNAAGVCAGLSLPPGLVLGLVLPALCVLLLGRGLAADALAWRDAVHSTEHLQRHIQSLRRTTKLPKQWSDFLGTRRLRIDGPGPPLTVTLDPRVGLGGPGTLLTIDSAGAIPPDLLVRGERRFSLSEDFETGDSTFDREVRIEGDEANLAAVLTNDVARSVSKGVREESLSLRRGRLQARIPTNISQGDLRSVSKLSRTSRKAWDGPGRAMRVVELAGDLCLSPSERPARLLEVVRHQPWDGVALAALRALINEHEGAPETKQALEEVLKQPLGERPRRRAPMVVLAAENTPGNALRSLLAVVLEPWSPLSSVERALELAAAHHPADDALAVLRAGLVRGEGREDQPVQRKAVEVVATELEPTVAIELLLQQVAEVRSVASADTRRTWAEALAALGGEGLEGTLLEMLAPTSGEAACGEAGAILVIETLGRIGGEASLLGLADWRAARPELSPWTSEQISAAIQRIRKRTGDVRLGSLTVVDEPQGAGGLSTVQQEGALSAVAEEPPESPSPAKRRRDKQRS